MTEMKIEPEFAAAIGITFIPIACAAGMAFFGIPHDDNFSNPEYAACRRRGNAVQDCMRHIPSAPRQHADLTPVSQQLRLRAGE